MRSGRGLLAREATFVSLNPSFGDMSFGKLQNILVLTQLGGRKGSGEGAWYLGLYLLTPSLGPVLFDQL
jgi:hypothetical protein